MSSWLNLVLPNQLFVDDAYNKIKSVNFYQRIPVCSKRQKKTSDRNGYSKHFRRREAQHAFDVGIPILLTKFNRWN